MAIDDHPHIYSNILIDTGPGDSGGVKFQRSYECVHCRLGFKESEITFFRGKPYGIPCGCANDISRLVSRGRG